MAVRPPRICSCGKIVKSGETCPCRARQKAEADKRRPNAYRRGYTSKWTEARDEFLSAHPMCQRPGCNKPASVVDHIIPHRGDLKLFWNRTNWQSLCTTCHCAWKQSQEKSRV